MNLLISSLLLFVTAGFHYKAIRAYPVESFVDFEPENENEILQELNAKIIRSPVRYEDSSNMQTFVNKMHSVNNNKETSNDNRDFEQTVYFLIKTLRQRNKRTSSLTFCHFKLCNMGRKRSDRIYQLINPEGIDDKEA